VTDGKKWIQSFGGNTSRLSIRPRCRPEGGVRTDLKKTGWEVVEWIHLAEDGDKFFEEVSSS
jgi:hypothetical protein